jgi:flagellin
MVIGTNITSMTVQESISNSSLAQNSSLEKLSSGLEINSASDNPSSLAIADKLRTQAHGLNQAISNITSGISLTQIADKAMTEQSNILDIIKQKLIQGSTATTSIEGKSAIGKDISKLLDQLDNISEQTTYNGQKAIQLNGAITTITDSVAVNASSSGTLDQFNLVGKSLADGDNMVIKDGNGDILSSITNNTGSTISGNTLAVALRNNFTSVSGSGTANVIGGYLDIRFEFGNLALYNRDINTTPGESLGKIQVGINSNDTISLPEGINATVDGLGLTGLTVGSNSLAIVDNALQKLNSWRSEYGSIQNQLESSMKNLLTSVANIKSSESIIRDTNYAFESAYFSKVNIQNQSGIFALAQANSNQSSILSFLN